MANGLILEHSALESRRFGMNVYRGEAESIDSQQLQAAIIENDVDVAIFRLPADQQYQVVRLERTGLPYLVADTLVYYETDLSRLEPKQPKNAHLTFVRCTSEHATLLGRLVSESFSQYRNHYSSNPILQHDLTDAYAEWAESYVDDRQGGRAAWVAQNGAESVGFITCSFSDKECEIVLNGVIPPAMGQGVYGDLIRFIQSHFKLLGYRCLKVSTQVQNYAVQKVWGREGFHMERALLTIHVNSLMKRTLVERRILPLTVSDTLVETLGQLTGHRNLLHFDKEIARKAGFEERIAHGLLVNSAISRSFATTFPGHGTICLDYSYRFLKPLYLGKTYSVDIGFPVIDEKKGYYRALAKTYDESGELCLFCYSDLLRKL